jgi:hypothetical protein
VGTGAYWVRPQTLTTFALEQCLEPVKRTGPKRTRTLYNPRTLHVLIHIVVVGNEASYEDLLSAVVSGAIDERPIPDITAGPDGDLWCTVTGIGGYIGRITPSGTRTEITPAGDAQGITTGRGENVWFTTLCHDGSSLRSDPIVSTCQKIPVASQVIVTTTRISSA